MSQERLTSLSSRQEQCTAPVSARSLRRIICALAALLVCTWLSGCALWPFGGKAIHSTEIDPSTRTATGKTSSSKGTDTSASGKSDSAGKAREKSAGKSGSTDFVSKEATGNASQVKSSDAGDSQESDPLHRKHDHAKYVRTIKNKAIDRLNKHRNATHAILCRNPTTDQWSFTLYFKRNRNYSYISYDWDGIDEDWVKIFASKHLPISRWRQHVRYSTRERECSTLKGGKLP